MTLKQLKREVSSSTGLTIKQVNEVLTKVSNLITSTVSNNERVYLAGFGSFLVKERKATNRRNPNTGEIINIPAHNTVSFRPGQDWNKGRG